MSIDPLAPHATPAQAAAIAAAIEQFVRASAPGSLRSEERADPWLRAAILEGVARGELELS